MKNKKLSPDNFWCFREWDYEKNKDLRPEDFTSVSQRIVWWKCRSGHSWQDRIANRAKGRGCPYDAGRRLPFNLKSLAVCRPGIAAEWDYEKNDSRPPKDVNIHNYRIKAWWCCRNGHSWKSKLTDRLRGNDYPICGNTDGNGGQGE